MGAFAKIFTGLTIFWVAALLFGQPRRSAVPEAIEELTTETAGQAIEQFRNTRFAGDFCLKFELIHYPRRAAEFTYEGILWGATVEGAPCFRIVFWKRGEAEKKHQFLMKNGRSPRVWEGGLGASVRELSQKEQGVALAPDLLYSPFDVMMPFVYWPNWRYEGPKRVQSRSTDIFLFSPPQGWDGSASGLKGIRVALDRTFNALIYAQQIGLDDAVQRTFRIVDLKKVQEQWIVKRIDFFDTSTRDKDRFCVTAAAMNLNLPKDMFAPESLESFPEIPSARQFETF